MPRILVIGKRLPHTHPDTPVTQGGKAFVDTGPVAVFLHQQVPFSTATVRQAYAFDKPAALTFLAQVNAWAGEQNFKNFQLLVSG